MIGISWCAKSWCWQWRPPSVPPTDCWRRTTFVAWFLGATDGNPVHRVLRFACRLDHLRALPAHMGVDVIYRTFFCLNLTCPQEEFTVVDAENPPCPVCEGRCQWVPGTTGVISEKTQNVDAP